MQRFWMFLLAALYVTTPLPASADHDIAPPDPNRLYGSAFFDKVLYRTAGFEYRDFTEQLYTPAANDVPLGNRNGDSISFGANTPFSVVSLAMLAPGSGGQVFWEYGIGNGQWRMLPDVRDPSGNFTVYGRHVISFRVPDDWHPTTIGGGRETYYWVRATTVHTYTVVPFASRGMGVLYNLRVRVEDELGNPVSPIHYHLSDCADTTIFGARALGNGVYDIAVGVWFLRSFPFEDARCALVIPENPFLLSDVVDTGPLTTALTDLSDEPIVLRYPIVVSLAARDYSPVYYADVLIGDTEPAMVDGNHYYFHTAPDGPLAVYAPGFIPDTGLPPEADTPASEYNGLIRWVEGGVVRQQTQVHFYGDRFCPDYGAGAIRHGSFTVCAGLVPSTVFTVYEAAAALIPIADAHIAVYTDPEMSEYANDFLNEPLPHDAACNTDADGSCELALAGGDYYFRISKIGYQPLVGSVTVFGNARNQVAVALSADP